MSGGNPSVAGTAIVVVDETVESKPFFVKDAWGGSCRLNPNGKVPLGADALAKYNELKAQLLSSGTLLAHTPAASCQNFFEQDAVRKPYFAKLQDAVSSQIPYDGQLSTLSMFDAGMAPPVYIANYPEAIKQYKRMPVCGYVLTNNGTAASQANAPNGLPRDVYINSNPAVYAKRLTQATILHEVLHNLTGLPDWLRSDQLRGSSHPVDLKDFLGMEFQLGVDPDLNHGTIDITNRLKAKQCTLQ
jgi:hypothetical protein